MAGGGQGGRFSSSLCAAICEWFSNFKNCHSLALTKISCSQKKGFLFKHFLKNNFY